MHLTFERHGKRTTAQVTNGDGELVGRVESKFTDASHFARACEELRVDATTFKRCLLEFEAAGVAQFDLAKKFELRIRGMFGHQAQALTGEDPVQLLLTACRTPWQFDEPVAAWDDRAVLAVVDLDSDTWTDKRLKEYLAIFQPKPSLSWVTKSGGLRLVYAASGELSAEEVASVAYLHLYTTEAFSSLEIKSDTRLSPGSVTETEQSSDYGLLKKWLHEFSVDDGEVKKWLAANGFEVGKRYPHDRCPVSPSSTAKGDPVQFGDHGVTCFVCEAHGVMRGGKAGYFPYSAFVGSSASSAVYCCIAGMCHWEHAKHIVEDKVGMSGHAAKLMYSAMIKLHHPGTKSTERVFLVGTDLLRMEGAWTNANGEPYTKSIRDVLSVLPAAAGAGGKASPAKAALLEQSFDLSAYGYPSLTPVFGMKMCEHSRSKDVQVVVQGPLLASGDMAKYRPRYAFVRAKDPWKLVEDACPGVNREYVKLLLVAKGFAEAQAGMPPMVFVSGPTSSAKTGSVKVAAAIAGDCVSEHVWTDNIDRIRQAIRDSKSTGTYVVFNEFFKEAERLKQSAVQAADFVLNLTPDSMSWKIWVGPVRLGALPVFVWTDTRIPDELKADAQLARRLVHVHLPVQVDWRDSLLRTVTQIASMRVHSKEHAEACNAIVSEVMDEFLTGITTFEAAAKKLGFDTMAESQEAQDSVTSLAAFFDAVCEAPELPIADTAKWPGRGWKLIVRGQETPLSNAWDAVRDDGWASSRKCSEIDWAKVAKLAKPAMFECRAHGQSRVAVRFKHGGRTDYLVNQECK